MRASLEQKLEHLFTQGFNIEFSFCKKNKQGKQVLGMFDNTVESYILPITGKSIKDVVNQAYILDTVIQEPEVG